MLLFSFLIRLISGSGDWYRDDDDGVAEDICRPDICWAFATILILFSFERLHTLYRANSGCTIFATFHSCAYYFSAQQINCRNYRNGRYRFQAITDRYVTSYEAGHTHSICFFDSGYTLVTFASSQARKRLGRRVIKSPSGLVNSIWVLCRHD